MLDFSSKAALILKVLYYQRHLKSPFRWKTESPYPYEQKIIGEASVLPEEEIYSALSFLVERKLAETTETGWNISPLGMAWAYSATEYEIQVDNIYWQRIFSFAPIPLERIKDVLDVGCGGAVTYLALKKMEARGLKKIQYTGVDISPYFLQVAQEILDSNNSVVLQKGDAKRLPYQNRFDLVLAKGVLLYVPPRLFLEQVLQVTGKGGWFIIIAPTSDVFKVGLSLSLRRADLLASLKFLYPILHRSYLFWTGNTFRRDPVYAPSLTLIKKTLKGLPCRVEYLGYVRDLPFSIGRSILLLGRKE